MSTVKCLILISFKMDDNDWYVGHMDRHEAETKILHPLNEHGTFLIRCSVSKRGNFALTLRDENAVKHYLICRLASGRFTIARKTFGSLQDLVDYYSIYRDELCTNLKKPCVRISELGENNSTCSSPYETDRSAIKHVRILGTGQFGEVWEGLWKSMTPVAIKTLKPGTMDPNDFLAEAQIMKSLTHPNLIQLFAVCTTEEPIYIITELMANGSLLNYLRGKKRIGTLLQLTDIIRIASEVSRGMVYLETMNYIHRDLAARNVLLGDNSVVKIADFGLARLIKEEEYQARQGTKFPIRWTAPEALSSNVFSIKSDVWSFGILLTELVTHGKLPYGEEMTSAKVMCKVEQGYQMPLPHGCPVPLYNIMVDCWNIVPSQRPTFETLQWKLEEYFTLPPTDLRAPGYQDILL